MVRALLIGAVWPVVAATDVAAAEVAATDVAATDATWQATWSHRVDRTRGGGSFADSDRDPRAHALAHALANTLALERQGRGSAFGARHRYDVVPLPGVDGVAAATNGHLHRLSATARRVREKSEARLEPTLAVSSNVGKHPKSFTWSDLQPNGAWTQRVAGSESQSLWLGAQADARLGRWLAYPTLRWRTETPASDWQVGFPDSHWRRRLGATWSLQLGVEPDGGQWQVRDRQFESRTRVRLERWQAAAALEWKPVDRVALVLVAGRALAGKVRYTLLDGRTVRTDVPDATLIGAQVVARF